MKSRWPTKKLGEVAGFQKGKMMPNSLINTSGSVPYILIDDLRSGSYSHFTQSNLGTACSPTDSLLVWDGANAGTVGGGLQGFVGSTISKISPSQVINPRFLNLILSSKFEEFNEQMHGAAIPHLNKDFVHSLPIVIPSLSIQRKIVERLDAIRKAQELCDKQISKTEELFESVLIKQLDQDKNWKVKKLPEIAIIQRGKFSPRPRNDPKYFGGDIPWIQTGEIVNSSGEIDKYTQTLNKEGIKVSRIFLKGTVVITIAANIGDLAILNIDAAFPDSIVGITVDETVINNKFLYYEMLLKKEYLNNQSTQAAQKNINIQILSDLDIFVPELNTQKKIVEKLDSIQEYKKLLLKQKSLLRELFDSVLYKSMKGEMD